MEISPATASGLGNKLASLDLTDEEGALLAALLREGPEVEGFGQADPTDPRIMFETLRKTNLPQVLGPLPGAWKIEEGTKGYTEVEWT